ncbi:hypothetical protein GP486_002935 [Trichoglossum hirsutum]|uniref:MMS19 nucleotide excision repair protein n=1 Tax=Trichoglossum hirsutum TaxID=265104 RepID=A0A9P8LE51_9PEZI|nr:hypothetical protein GP486_002935 [Trichoglossum hirsutum]
MSDAQRFLLTIDGNQQEAIKVAERSAERIENKDLTLVELVGSLGEYLTDDDTTMRSKAVAYLTAVLAAMLPTTLTRQQIAVIREFLCARIEDESGLKETAQGLFTLQQMSRFSGEDAVQVATTLFTKAQDLQRHPQGTRFTVLTLLDALMSDQRDALKSIGSDFVVGITDLVSGEKDPRNLMVVFSMLRVVIVEWNIMKHTEVLFDAVYCYFPITFKPLPGDPYGITAQDLKARLRDCIAASHCFASHAFPALVDKLDSTSPSVKKDVLQTINACASNYSPTTMSTYSIQLWDSLKYEVFNAQEEDLAAEALIAIRTIAVKLSFGLTSTTPKSPLARFLLPITTECNERLREPQQKQARPAAQILGSLATASSVAFTLTIKSVVVSLLTLYQDTDGIGKQRALLEVLGQLLESALTVYGIWGSMEEFPQSENPLDPFKDKLFEIFCQALMGTARAEASFRIVALRCLLRLVKLRSFLAENEIGMIVQYLDEIVLEEDPDGKVDLREEAIQALLEISKIKSSLIMDITFPAFMAKLPDSAADGESRYMATLEGLAKLSVGREIFEVLMRRLLNKLDVVLQNDSSPIYPRAILSTLHYVLSLRSLEGDPNLQGYYDRLVSGLIRKAVLPLRGVGKTTTLNAEGVLEIIGRLANLIVRSVDIARQKSVVPEIFNLYSSQEKDQFNPLGVDSSIEKRRTIILSSYLLAGIRREVGSIQIQTLHAYNPNLPQISLPWGKSPLLENLMNAALHENAPLPRLAILRTISLLVNKWPSYGQKSPTEVFSTLVGDKSPSEDFINGSLRVLFWLNKALLLRASPLSIEYTSFLLDYLNDARHGRQTARAFAILLADDELLSKPNHAVIRLLHKQRLFSYCLPKIADGFQAASATIKPNYLIALSSILRHVPSAVIMPNLNTLLPLLLQSLDLDDPDVKAATIDTMSVTVSESPQAIASHVSSVIARLLNAADSTTGRNPPRVRQPALRCLSLLPGAIKNETLLPFKLQVIRDLTGALDDPKRHVRKEAVDCRARWFRMGEPEED